MSGAKATVPIRIVRLIYRHRGTPSGSTTRQDGVALGLAGAIAMTGLMKSALYGITATDPATYAGVSFLLVLIALIACAIPTRRAVRVDPTIALRYE